MIAGGKNKKTWPFQINRRNFLRQSTLAGLAAASGLPELSWAVRGNQLHIRNYLDVSTLDMPFALSGADNVIGLAIYQNLLQFKTDGTWDTELDVAEYFEAIDDTHYAFRLKPGQIFSNGFGEMIADDVKFSFERVIDPDMNAIGAPDLGTLSHVDVHDRYSGTIVLSSPYAAFVPIAVASYPIFSRHPYTAALLAANPSTNPDAAAERIELSGEVPSLLQRPPGCEFHNRCPRVQADCRESFPARESSNGKRAWNCFHPLF